MNNQALKKGSFIKIIMGLGNISLPNIKKLGAIYSKTKVNMFDVTPDEGVISALKEGIKSQNLNPDDFIICTSFSFADDVHGSKAKIDQLKCDKCGKCISKCPYGAIKDDCTIIYEKCIGCKKCKDCNAIFYEKDILNPVDVLKKLDNCGINAVELHVNGLPKNKIVEEVKKIKKIFPKIMIGICMSYKKRPISEVKEIIYEVQKIICPQKLIFQSDGVAMSGTNNDLYCAKQAVDFAKELSDVKDIYIILSGGCNQKTNELVKKEGVNISGIAYGSFARILADEYMQNSEFWYNINIINQAIEKCSILNDYNR